MDMNVDCEEYVDWKGKMAEDGKHGGRIPAALVCVVEVMENMAFISPASNMVTYFTTHMHYPVARASNMLTNYMGTSFLLTMFGGFISDSFVSRFWTVVLFGSIELLGLILMTIQASTPLLQAPLKQPPSLPQAAMLYTGLYAMAVGVGGVKASLPAHGADQFGRSNRRLVSVFFSMFFFCLCAGGFLAVTVLAWVQENKGWQWGFGVCAGVLCVGLCVFVGGVGWFRHQVPMGSPFTRIFKVLLSTAKYWKSRVHEPTSLPSQELDDKHQITKFRFLEKSLQGGQVTRAQVEETRIFLRLLPIFLSTIMMNCCLAQLQTFSVHQGVTMNRHLTTTFQIPVPSLTTIPLIVMLVSVPLFHRLSLKPLHRIGAGLLLASLSMAIAAAVEVKRKSSMSTEMSVLWLGLQYLLLGVSDMFTLAGMLEFFYSEAPENMRSLCTSLSWCSTSMGYFLSSVLVTVVNTAGGWLMSKDMNENRLELFYALLCVLNFVNFLNYMVWAKWY